MLCQLKAVSMFWLISDASPAVDHAAAQWSVITRWEDTRGVGAALYVFGRDVRGCRHQCGKGKQKVLGISMDVLGCHKSPERMRHETPLSRQHCKFM